jgi:hypothetical protein
VVVCSESQPATHAVHRELSENLRTNRMKTHPPVQSSRQHSPKLQLVTTHALAADKKATAAKEKARLAKSKVKAARKSFKSAKKDLKNAKKLARKAAKEAKHAHRALQASLDKVARERKKSAPSALKAKNGAPTTKVTPKAAKRRQSKPAAPKVAVVSKPSSDSGNSSTAAQ